MGKKEIFREFWWGNLKSRDLLEEIRVDGSIILKWILN